LCQETKSIATLAPSGNDDADLTSVGAPTASGGWIGKLVSLGVSIAILAVLWSSARQADLLGTIGQVDPRYLALAAALMPVAMATRGFRLDRILGKSGVRLGLRRATIITFVGTSLNVLLPSNLGDVAKAYYGYRYGLAKEIVLSVVIIDKAFGMIAAMLVGVAAAASEGLWAAMMLAGAIAAALIVLVFVPQLIPWRLMGWVLNKVLGKRLGHERALEASRLPIGLKLAAMGLSLLACGLAYGQYYLICRALHLPVPMAFVLLAAPLMDLAKAIPLTANGLGTREAVAVYVFGRIGVASGEALLSSLIFTAVSLWLPALVGAPFVWLALRGRRRNARSARAASG